MKIKILKSNDKNILRFVLSDSYPEFANALRRALISEVPVMAISKVHYLSNNSALYNEVLALRLGLIALTSDAKTYVSISDCSCKGVGCSKCTVYFTLDVKGPGMVYARDLKSTDAKVKPVNPDTPLVKLFEGQSVKLEAEAILGYGSDHARFNGAMASYQYYPKITTGGCGCKEVTEVCPKHVFDYKAKKVEIKDIEDCDLCMACVEACSCKKLKVDSLEDKFLFTVESWGQYDPKDMVKLAINKLLERTNEFSEKLSK